MPNALRNYIFGTLLLCLSFGARLWSYPIITSDYTYFLAKWFDTLKAHPGLTAFATPFADYAPLYLYALKGLTFLPLPSLYSIKTLSVTFEVIIALLVCLLVQKTSPTTRSKSELFLIFTLVLSIPTFIINSSLWAQSDVIYTTFIIACLYFIFTDTPWAAALFFGLAFCVKFQSIFFIPILVGYLLRRQEDLTYLLLIPVMFFVSVLPALTGGGSFSYWLLIYIKESGEYSGLSLSAPSVFAFTSGLPLSASTQHLLLYTGLGLAAVVAVIMTALMARASQSSARRVVLLCLLCALSIPWVLPRMHERYFYLADTLSLLYALYAPRQWFVPVLVIGASLVSYMAYLSQLSLFAPFAIDLRIPSLMLLIAIGIVVMTLKRLPEAEPAALVLHDRRTRRSST